MSKRFKRILSLFCAMVMCLSLCSLFAACGGEDDTQTETLATKFKNQAYTENATSYQYLDVYLPSSDEGPFPLVVFVHGGGWYSLSRSYGVFDTMFKQLRKDGYAVAYVDYTLSQVDGNAEATVSGYPQMIYDVKAAIRYLRANAETYRIDPDNIILLGESAGAHLSMLCAATDGDPEYEDLTMGNADVSSSVNGVISVSGPSLYDINESMTISSMKIIIGADYTEEDWQTVSPYFQVDENMCPVLLAHGQIDTTVPIEHSYQMEEKLKSLIGEDNVTTYYPENASHVDKTVFNSDEFIAIVEEFLEKYFT